MDTKDQQATARLNLVFKRIRELLAVREYKNIKVLKEPEGINISGSGVTGSGNISILGSGNEPSYNWLKTISAAYSAVTVTGEPFICLITIALEKSQGSHKDTLLKEVSNYNHVMIVTDGQIPKKITNYYSVKNPTGYCEVINHRAVILNLIEHDETEKSRVVRSDEDIKAFNQFVSMSQVETSRLTKKSVYDPMMIWIGAKVGDIIITRRNYEASKFIDIYELVVDIKKTTLEEDQE